MLIGYARVSTTDQNLDLQKDALKAAGCKRIHTDTSSGSRAKRPGLDQALQNCREGDTLVVWRLDRLGRSLPHLVETVRQLQDREVGFKSLQENIDTTTSGGKFIFHVFASLAEFERDIIRERTRAGLTAARARGRVGGRPPGVDEKKKQAALALKKDLTRSVAEICQLVGISRNTYYKYTGLEKKAPASPPASPVMRLRFDLHVDNNTKFVRGKTKVRRLVEQEVLCRYLAEKRHEGVYHLKIPYASEEELEATINEIFEEVRGIAYDASCGAECTMTSLDDPERTWDD